MSELLITLTLSEDSIIADNERLIKLNITPKNNGGNSGSNTTTESDPPVEGFKFSSDPVIVEPAKDATLNIRITDGKSSDDVDENGRKILTPNLFISDISVSGSLEDAEYKVENGLVVIKTNKRNTDRDNDKKLGLITISGGGKSRSIQVLQSRDSLQMEQAPLGGDDDLSGIDDKGVIFKRYHNYLNNLLNIREISLSLKFKSIKMKYYKSGLIEYLTYGSFYEDYDYIFTVTNSGWFKVTDIKDHYIVFGDIISYEGQLLGRITSSFIEFKFQSIPYAKILNIARYSFNGSTVDTSVNHVKDMETKFESTYWASGTSSEVEGPGALIEGTGYDPVSDEDSSGDSGGNGGNSSTATKELYLTVYVNTNNTNMNIDRNVLVTKYI